MKSYSEAMKVSAHMCSEAMFLYSISFSAEEWTKQERKENNAIKKKKKVKLTKEIMSKQETNTINTP